MRRPNLSLRLQRSLMEEARKAAKSEGVSLNQLINVALAEKLSALRTGECLQEQMRRDSPAEPEQTPDQAEIRNRSTGSDKSSIGPLPVLMATVARALRASQEARSLKAQPAPVIGGLQAQPAPPPDGERAGETDKLFGRATPQLGKPRND